MIDIPQIFKNKTLDGEKAASYGFSASENGLKKAFPIQGGAYTLVVTLSGAETADFRVYDDEGEEYMPAHIHHSTGAFVGKIHQECEAILKDISEKCFTEEHFKWDQSRRILRFIKETLHAEPEYLWNSLPDCAALRVPVKKPWFAIVCKIPKEKLGIAEDGIAEIINLKDEPKNVSVRIVEQKARPAYHMNKQHWYTVLMDGSLEDEELIEMIQTSFRNVCPEKENR